MLQAIGDILRFDPSSPLMISSGLFPWLFLVMAVGATLLRKARAARLLWLLVCSYYCYYKTTGWAMVWLMAVTVSDWLIAMAIARAASTTLKRTLVAVSVTLDLSLLAFFKYASFFAGMVGVTFVGFDVLMPVGISFYVFQSIGYTVDVYRGRVEPTRSLLDYAFFLAFFPQLVMGPILRAGDMLPQLQRPATVTRSMLGIGVWLVVCGLFKKAVLADFIGANFVNRVFADPLHSPGIVNLLATYGYAFKLYLDFSGYSEMAIGLAALLGFKIPPNFNSPYQSASITEFWRRWHISLSLWLRDYLYISLGGNRKGKARQNANLFTTMMLGGLWHGASWNFVIWGALHGAGLVVHKWWMRLTGQDPKHPGRHPWPLHIVAVLVTFHFVCFTWIFFNTPTIAGGEVDGVYRAGALDVLSQICFHFAPDRFGAYMSQFVGIYRQPLAFLALAVVLHFVPESVEKRCRDTFAAMPLWTYAVALITIVVLITQLDVTLPFDYITF